MSQADSPNITIPSRISFSSIAAVPPRRARHAAILPAVQVAHRDLIASLAQLTPHDIRHNADRFDVMERRDHLNGLLASVTRYAKAILADTKELAPCGYVHDETGCLEDASAEITGALSNACDRMLEDQAQAAE